jgi:hypothetical protein
MLKSALQPNTRNSQPRQCKSCCATHSAHQAVRVFVCFFCLFVITADQGGVAARGEMVPVVPYQLVRGPGAAAQVALLPGVRRVGGLWRDEPPAAAGHLTPGVRQAPGEPHPPAAPQPPQWPPAASAPAAAPSSSSWLPARTRTRTACQSARAAPWTGAPACRCTQSSWPAASPLWAGPQRSSCCAAPTPAGSAVGSSQGHTSAATGQ